MHFRMVELSLYMGSYRKKNLILRITDFVDVILIDI